MKGFVMKRALILFLCLLTLPSVAGAATPVYPEGFTSSSLTDGSIDYMKLDPTPTPPTCEVGIFYWDEDDNTLAICSEFTGSIMQSGREMWVQGVNKTGVTLLDGQVVLINGAQGNRPSFALANAAAESTSEGTLGIVTSDILNNSEGLVTVIGEVHNQDTHLFATGDTVYLSADADGGIVNSPPSAPNHRVRLGKVTVSHNTQGIIWTQVDNGQEIYELHDVSELVANSVANDTLNFTGVVWVNSPVIAGEIELHNHTGITISTTTGIKNITGVDDGDASGSVVVDGANGTITMPTMITSLFDVCFSLSFSGGNGDQFHGHITINDADDVTGFEREMGTTQFGVVANCGLISLSSGDIIKMTLEENGDNRDALLTYFKLMVTKPR